MEVSPSAHKYTIEHKKWDMPNFKHLFMYFHRIPHQVFELKTKFSTHIETSCHS